MRTWNLLFVLIVFAGFSGSAVAQSPRPDSGPFADGNIIQAAGSATLAERALLQRTSHHVQQEQIRIDVLILAVDSQTRDAVYQTIPGNRVQTDIARLNVPRDGDDFGHGFESDRHSEHRATSSSVVSTAVLHAAEFRGMLAAINTNQDSEVLGRPTVIAMDGQVAAIEQQTQRPFASQLQKVDNGGESVIESGIEVLNEGIQLALRTNVEGEEFQLEAKLQQSRVNQVRTCAVYGFGKEKKLIQVPTHEVQLARASQRLVPGQTLLFDPYFAFSRTVARPSQSPIVGKVPYINRVFVSADVEETTMNTLVFLTPRKLPAKENSLESADESSPLPTAE